MKDISPFQKHPHENIGFLRFQTSSMFQTLKISLHCHLHDVEVLDRPKIPIWKQEKYESSKMNVPNKKLFELKKLRIQKTDLSSETKNRILIKSIWNLPKTVILLNKKSWWMRLYPMLICEIILSLESSSISKKRLALVGSRGFPEKPGSIIKVMIFRHFRYSKTATGP